MADFVRLSRNYSSSPRRFGHERRQEAIGIVTDGDRDAGIIGCRVIQCSGYGSFDLRTVVRSTGVYDARKKRGRPIRRAGRIVVNGKIHGIGSIGIGVDCAVSSRSPSALRQRLMEIEELAKIQNSDNHRQEDQHHQCRLHRCLAALVFSRFHDYPHSVPR